uniref:Uncharacterized protein n=1 Tax=Astyanax mexicanus TaxID=7994 RepID=A0A8B9HZ64_ASTMX
GNSHGLLEHNMLRRVVQPATSRELVRDVMHKIVEKSTDSPEEYEQVLHAKSTAYSTKEYKEVLEYFREHSLDWHNPKPYHPALVGGNVCDGGVRIKLSMQTESFLQFCQKSHNKCRRPNTLSAGHDSII